MSRVLNISEAASLAFHAMAMLAAPGGRRLTTRAMAEPIRASAAHLSKVLQRLEKAGLVKAVRGPNGGFSIGRKAPEITLLEIYQAMEGALPGSHCLFGTRICGGKHCIMGDLLKNVDREVRDYLKKTRLSDLPRISCGKEPK